MAQVRVPRLCKDCRHFVNDSSTFSLKYGKCALTSRTTSAKVDPVDGTQIKQTRELSYASLARGPYGECGADGALYDHEADARIRFRNAWLAPMIDTAKLVTFAVAYVIVWVVSLDSIARAF